MTYRLSMVHENVDDTTSIGRLAKWAAEVALGADFEVTLVANDVAPELIGHVRIRPLYVPPPPHLIQWLAARRTISRALRRVDADVIHVHQPQVAALADVWQVHFLSRANVEAGGLASTRPFRSRLQRWQQRSVATAEDRYLRVLPDTVEVVFCSEWLRGRFEDLYGPAPRQSILTNPAPDPVEPVPGSRRTDARRHVGLEPERFTLGFLGGDDPRKGGAELIDALVSTEGAQLLAAGTGAERLRDERLGPRLVRLGHLSGDALERFWEAIDVLVVPSRFDPYPVVVGEAAARGIPSIVSSNVGSSVDLSRWGAGAIWNPGFGDLQPILDTVRENAQDMGDRAHSMARELSHAAQAEQLLTVYERAIERRPRSHQRP